MVEADDLAILMLSLEVAITATLAIVPAGLALAWAISRWRGHGRVVVESFLALPLVLPPTAVGIVLLALLGQHGFLGRTLGALGIEIVFTWKAAALASAIMAFPLFVRSARIAHEEIDPRLL